MDDQIINRLEDLGALAGRCVARNAKHLHPLASLWCAHCRFTRNISKIKQYTDNRKTPLCPVCGVDALVDEGYVIGIGITFAHIMLFERLEEMEEEQ